MLGEGFRIRGNPIITIDVKDKDIFFSDDLGTAQIPVSSLRSFANRKVKKKKKKKNKERFIICEKEIQQRKKMG